MRRDQIRRQTRFGSWVSSYGVSRLQTTLGQNGCPITRGGIYEWLAGRRTPRPPVAVKLVQLSAGSLTLDDVFGHVAAIPGTRGPAGE